MKKDDQPGNIVQLIKPRKGIFDIDFAELWRFRELFFTLVWRDVKVKYKQTLLGAAWAVLVPFIQMVVFTFIFNRLAKLPTDGVNPQVFYFSGLILWTYFSTAVTMSSNSLVANQQFLTKIYFPRLILPVSPSLSALVDFVIAFVILCVLMAIYGIAVNFAVLFLPFFIIIALLSASGTGMFFSALNIKYRDIRIVMPFILQIWMYGTVIMPFSKIPESWGAWRYLYGLNPMSGAIEGFRWSLLNSGMSREKIIDGVSTQAAIPAPVELIAISTLAALLFFSLGFLYFKRLEDTFADIV